ncbi:30S ribosomal protein S9 [bacterium AB1]|nr:30S ribosomal protein S9 [bacterium AB1]
MSDNKIKNNQNIIFFASKKSANCRLYNTQKTNNILVNKKTVEEYFNNIDIYIQPIKNVISHFNIENLGGFICNVRSGGKSSQSNAICFAIGKFLRHRFKNTMDEEQYKEYNSILRKLGLVTVDRRFVYPKIYGRKKACKKRQTSKR